MNIKNLLNSTINKAKRFRLHRGEIKKQKDKRRVAIANKVSLTREQKKQIDVFFTTNYGKRISYRWHMIYTAISGKFDYRFFPEYLYAPDFQMISNDPDYYNGLQDKNILPRIVKGSGLNIKTPAVIFSCSNGIITNADNRVMAEKEMLAELYGMDSFFIKPSINSNSGIGCELITKRGDNIGNYAEVVKSSVLSHGKDFIIQKPLINQDDIAQINPTSVNSFRIISFIIDGQINVSPIILRVGRNDSCCDNAHSGGLFVAVSDDGEIISNGKTEFGEDVEIHPNSNIHFKGYKIKNVYKITNAAKELAALFPHVGVIDWDFILDEEGEPVVVEANMMYGSVWLIQMAHGESVFGDKTARVLQLIKKNKKLF